MKSTKKTAMIALFTAMAVIIHVLEAMLPLAMPIPGIKLGLANVITLLAIVLLGSGAAWQVVIFRVLIGSFLTGTFFSITFFLSLAGGLVAILTMSFCYRYLKGFSLIGISILGALSHNLAQLTVAALLMWQKAIFFYLPVLLLTAIPTGILVGYVVILLSKPLSEALALERGIIK